MSNEPTKTQAPGSDEVVLNDPQTYERLRSLPFEDSAQADAALDAFYEDLRALRIKHHIPELYVVCGVRVHVASGDGIGEFRSALAMGHALGALPLVAWAMGLEQARHAEMIAAMAAGSGLRRREGPR